MRATWQLSLWTGLWAVAFSCGCTTLERTTNPVPTDPALSGGNAQATSKPSDLYGSMPQQPGKDSSGGMWGALNQTGQALASALRIEPKVSPAADPVKLDNQPDNQQKAAQDLHYHAGFFFESEKKFGEASAHYRKALDLNPDDAKSLAGYGRAQEQLGNPLEAEQHLRRACELAPQDPGMLVDLGMYYSRRQNYSGAIHCLQQAVNMEPVNTKYRSYLARSLMDAGRVSDAQQHLTVIHGPQGAQRLIASHASNHSAPQRLPAQ